MSRLRKLNGQWKSWKLGSWLVFWEEITGFKHHDFYGILSMYHTSIQRAG